MKHLPSVLILLTIFAGSAITAAAQSVPLLFQPLSPMSATPGGHGFLLTAQGAGFAPNAVVKWNGTALTTTFVSSGELNASVPGRLIGAAGTASVTVINPGNRISNPLFFQISPPTTSVSMSRTDYAFGGDYFVRTGDFDGDGRLDLVVGGYQFGTVSIYLNKGDGTFQSPSVITGFSNVWSLAVGDVNSDGKADLAVANHDGDTVSVLLGNGDGSFQTARNFPAGRSPNWVVMGDFNRDGNLDLAVADGADSAVSILVGDGSGRFGGAVEYATAGAYSVAIGDFNRDGVIDLAVTNDGSPGTVTVLRGRGDGTFTLRTDYRTISEPLEITVADVNHDGTGDLVLTTSTSITVLMGNGEGTFQKEASYKGGQGEVAAGQTATGDRCWQYADEKRSRPCVRSPAPC